MEGDEGNHRLDDRAEDHAPQEVQHHGPGVLADETGGGLGHEDGVAQRES